MMPTLVKEEEGRATYQVPDLGSHLVKHSSVRFFILLERREIFFLFVQFVRAPLQAFIFKTRKLMQWIAGDIEIC